MLLQEHQVPRLRVFQVIAREHTHLLNIFWILEIKYVLSKVLNQPIKQLQSHSEQVKNKKESIQLFAAVRAFQVITRDHTHLLDIFWILELKYVLSKVLNQPIA